MEDIIEQLTSYRIKIDEIYKNVCLIESTEYVRECKKCLLLSRTHLGRLKGLLGEEHPYPPVNSTKQLQKVVDTYEDVLQLTDNHVKLVGINWVRSQIEELTNNLWELDNNDDLTDENGKYRTLLAFTIKDLYDAKSWLGWELGRMRDSVINAVLEP